MKIYQLVSYLNGYNKKTKTWDSLYSDTTIAVGRSGLKTFYELFEQEKYRNEYQRKVNDCSKYLEVRGKVELHEPHIHENGIIGYWGDKILISYNPDNI